QIAARLPAQLFEPLIERHQPTFGLCIVRDAHQDANALHSLELLRARRERIRRHAAEQRDELATLHSITSSARASSVAGISRPSALAVGRLMTNSNLVDWTTGSSAGLAPLRMRPAAVKSFVTPSTFGLVGLTISPMRAAVGRSSRNSPSCF